jgi:hypothetical protein
LSFQVADVGYAIDLLNAMAPREPLNLAEDLCTYSQNMLNRDNDLVPLPDCGNYKTGDSTKREAEGASPIESQDQDSPKTV